jgi:ACS family sodium-dependent inorganic phosphate cotransporter
MATIASTRPGIPKRLILVGMCFAATSICYVDRVNISVAVIPMAEQFHWTATTKGTVLTSFFIGYLLAMLPGGWLIARFGGRLVLGVALAAWSLATLLTPTAAFAGMPFLIAVRIAMGVAEAATFPAVIALFARWLPPTERSRAVALQLGGIPVGTIVGLSAAGGVVAAYGWAAMFWLFGAAGLVFAAIWFFAVHESPGTHPRIGAAEHGLLAAREAATARGPVPWRILLSKRAVWAIIITHFCSNWTLYLMLTWMPSYLHDVQHLNVGKAGLAAVLPWACYFVAANGAGYGCDRLVARGVSLLVIRKAAQTAGLLGASAGLLLAAQATSPAEAVAMLCFALGANGLISAGFAANHLDIAPRYAGPLYAVSNTAGTLPGIIGVYITGWLLDATGGYGWTFAAAAAVNVIGTVVWLAWAQTDPVVD